MIFKKLFRPLTQPKWQHKDPEVRIKALEELSVEQSKHKTILHELAFNDPSEKVRKLTLERLNDFSLWWQASKSEKNERVKKLAEDNIRKGLLGNADFEIEDNVKTQFIDQCKKGTLLEELALKDKSDETRFKLLSKLNKNNLFQQSLQDKGTSEWLKEQIIGRIDELPILEKLLKKADGGLKSVLTSKIDGIKSAIEKPLKLKKDVALMLAKLNALKDKMDIEDIEARHAQLTLEWETLKESFTLLAENEVAEYQAKYDKISKSLNTIVAPLKEKWAQQQAIKADELEKTQNKAAITERLSAVEAQVTHAVSEQSEAGDEQDYAAPLKQIRQDLTQLNLNQNDKNEFIRQIEQFHQKIDQIPLITQCIAQATALIDELSAVAIPTNADELKDVNPTYKAWQQRWRDNQSKMGLAFPASINEAYKQLNTQWREATTPIQKEQDQLFTQARKSLSDLRYLLSSGKYRRAFGLFKKVSFLNEQLNEWQQSKISRDFEAAKKKVEELADWQEYIATPRKQQLLDEMVDLAENPVDSPQEQAQKVRFTRQMWNSLGRAAQDSDETLNKQFNDACEKAFEVCRNFYAEREAIRAINLKAKEAICAQLKDTQALLEGENVPWQKIESTISRIRKEFKQSGEVDRDKASEINKHFHSLIDPIQQALRTYHDENASLKEKLIKTAENLLEEADVFGAANQLKDLQQKWKTIGFAGGKKDGLIWKQFRQINDQIFTRRDEVKNEQEEQSQQQFGEFNRQLEEIEEAILNTDQLTVLNKNQAALSELTNALDKEPKRVQTQISGAAGKLASLIKTRKDELIQAAAKEKYVTLFNQFEQFSSNGSIDPEIESSGAWNDVIAGLTQTSDSALRYDLTIQLEIVCGIESPVRDTDRRMELQMALLSNKMNDGEMASRDDLLKSWIEVGCLSEDDGELLDRGKALYL